MGAKWAGAPSVRSEPDEAKKEGPQEKLQEMGRILIADDEQDFVDILAETFSDCGYEIHTAGSGEEAIRNVVAKHPHVMLLDVHMPGAMNGTETLKRAKEIDPRLCVIMVTASSDPETIRQTMELGAFDYITKPFDLSCLKGRVKTKMAEMLA